MRYARYGIDENMLFSYNRTGCLCTVKNFVNNRGPNYYINSVTVYYSPFFFLKTNGSISIVHFGLAEGVICPTDVI